MTSFPHDHIVTLFQQSQAKDQLLLTWSSDKFSELRGSKDIASAAIVLKQVNDLVSFISEKEENDVNISLTLAERIAHLYVLCLEISKVDTPNVVYDSSLFLCNVLCEEQPLHTESGSKKKAKKKSYLFSSVKFVSAVALKQISTLYTDEVHSLLPSVLADVLKNIKKTLEKEKYMHAGFLVCLMDLVVGILKSSQSLEPTTLTKYQKLFKTILQEIPGDMQKYPTDFVNGVILAYGQFFRYEHVLAGLSSDSSLEYLKSKLIDNNYMIYGFLQDGTRLAACTCLAEILFDWTSEKKLLSLHDALGFIAEVFLNSESRSVKTACFETLSYFIGLGLATDDEFLAGENYLNILMKLTSLTFKEENMKLQKLDCITRYLEFFEDLHEIILPHVSESSKVLILFAVFDCNKERILELLKDKEGEIDYSTIVFLQLSNILMTQLSSIFSTNSRNLSNMKKKLILLSTSGNFQIRIHASQSLKTFLKYAPSQSTDVIETSLEALSKELSSSQSFSFSKCHGYAFILATLIEISSPEYVSSELIMRIMIFATTLLKEHPFGNSLASYYKQLISWILLCGLMNYDDTDFLRMQTPQLFLFWNGILTHTFSYGDEDELYKNVELRNHALTCLLCYLERVEIDSEIAKQVSFILTKCSNFSNSITLKTKAIDNVLLQNENRILQVYLKIHHFAKDEFNSAILVLIVKNFADPKLSSGHNQAAEDKFINREMHFNMSMGFSEEISSKSLFLDNSGFAYGLSSKVGWNFIDPLRIANGHNSTLRSFELWAGERSFWYSIFENQIHKPITSVLSYDSLVLLYGSKGYSRNEMFSPRVTTSIINSSVEVFSYIFPFLNGKVQYSVLESMNSCILSKNTVTLRSIAIGLNCLVSIYGALCVAQENGLRLEESVADLLLKTVHNLPVDNEIFTVRLKAECVGLILSAVARTESSSPSEGKDYVNQTCDIFWKNIYDHNDPYSRVFNAFSIACIHRYNPKGFNHLKILTLLETLVCDPHPVVHTWTLESISILIENLPSMDIANISKMLILLNSISTDEKYGRNSRSVWSFNYGCCYNSHRIIGKILLHLTQLLGPEVEDLNSGALNAFKSMVFMLMDGNDTVQSIYAIKITNTLAAFKFGSIFFTGRCVPIAATFIKEALYVNLIGPTGYKSSSYRPSNSVALKAGFELFRQYVRLEIFKTLNDRLEALNWAYLSLFPTSVYGNCFIEEWFDHSCHDDLCWVERLQQLFFISRNDLLSIVTGKSHAQSLQSSNAVLEEANLPDTNVEERSFTVESSHSVKNDTLPWQTKFLLLRLLRKLLLVGAEDDRVKRVLFQKVPDMIRMSFSASTINVPEIRKAGIDVLGLIIELFDGKENGLENASLADEDAQLVSALMPAFGADSFPTLIPTALKVCAIYLCSCCAPLKEGSRIVNLLVSALAEISDNSDTWVIGEVPICTKRAKIEIALSVLDSWAYLTINAAGKTKDSIHGIVKQYVKMLAPLWIIHLREYVSLRNSKKNEVLGSALSGQDENWRYGKYDSVWINFANAIGCVHALDSSILEDCLKQEDLHSFVFVIFAQCLEQLTLNFDSPGIKSDTLVVMHTILCIEVPCDPFFNDGLQDEVVEIFERLALSGNREEKFKLVDVVEALVLSYLNRYKEEDEFLLGADTVYHLLRIIVILICPILPFIKTDGGELINVPDDADLRLLKKCFTSAAKVINQFPGEFRMDLNACLLFIVGRIYECDGRNTVVPVVLPLLKTILGLESPSDGEVDLVAVFFEASKSFIFGALSQEVAITTVSLLNNSRMNCISDCDVEPIVNLCYGGLKEEHSVEISSRFLEDVIKTVENSIVNRQIVRTLLLKLSEELKNGECRINVNVVIKLLKLFATTCIDSKVMNSQAALAISLNIVLRTYQRYCENKSLFFDTVSELIHLDVECGKRVVNENLEEELKSLFVELLDTGNYSNPDRNTKQIELKSFT